MNFRTTQRNRRSTFQTLARVLALGLLLTSPATADPGAPDTVRFESEFAQPGAHFPVKVTLFNDETLTGASLGFRWGTADIFLDSISFIGSKLQSVPASQLLTTIDNTIRHDALIGFVIFSDPPIPASDSLYATLWFTASPGATAKIINVDSAMIPPSGDFLLVGQSGNEEIFPQYAAGAITIGCGALGDLDGDLICDNVDNCASVANPTQVDSDGDNVGDECDICAGFSDAIDTDLDGVPDGCDLCPGFNDTVDSDGDGVPDGCDICPAGPDNIDTDADGVADACDICPGFNDTLDADADGTPDGCDICPAGPDNFDADADGVPDACDNCPNEANPDQADADGNGVGDVCEPCCDTPGDANNSGGFNIADITFNITRIFSGGPAPVCQDEADANGNNSFNIEDVTYGIARIFAGGPAPVCGPAGG